MDRDQLIHELRESSYVTLKPSTTHGIGVFAIVDIPKGCRSMFAKEEGEWTKLSFAEVESLPEHARYLVENFCLYDESDYFVPSQGFKQMDISLYLNHSETPNIISIDEGREFEAVRDIRCGEELFVDYGTLVNE